MLRAKFAKSPLTEVICGVEFNATEFSSVHFGLYWQTIRNKFPNPPLDRPPIGTIEFLSILPNLRRVWFESEDRRQLIQLQANRFHYNWRRQDEEDQYPHFQEIYPRFAQEWQDFQDWWISTESSPLQPIRYELSYINQIDQAFGWNSVSDHQKIFKFLANRFDDLSLKTRVFDFNLELELKENNGKLSVRLHQGVKPNDNLPVIILELTASTIGINATDSQTWFDLAHKSTVETFLSLVTDEIKKEWGFKWLD
ncbi:MULTISPECIES: TIGR04255 family protein [Pseudanabaena]|uniref:TIGR04255 family protein n=2 Tax=Pseudanabaena TaxID=1152 RepID=L8N2L6_9CYAN|nr:MULTISPECIES: TIGR04255 family protein [Pseudanabaena]ELS32513.1 hypothetical protein Pse7429DRAFT_2039 [Pseudanabaena biceps PCC 7429]MDG3495248.1 TIGR04255 family protein [Pseudanabaena catenata USMAC16]